MNDIERQMIEKEIEELKVLQQKQAEGQTNQDIQAFQLREQEKSMVKDQIDLGEVLYLIENLLRGRMIKEVANGGTDWVDPIDRNMVVLSEHGVQLIMNTICFYLNKNTLLSYYKEEVVDRKMEDFATDLADTVFMEYEKIFEYPTIEDCKEVLNERIKRKTELRSYALELMGKEYNKEKITKGILNEMENKIEDELNKIKEQIIKNKLKRFLILIREVQDIVHSTYLRALFGSERRTLRQHIHVTESMSPNFQQKYKEPSKINPINWFRN